MRRDRACGTKNVSASRRPCFETTHRFGKYKFGRAGQQDVDGVQISLQKHSPANLTLGLTKLYITERRRIKCIDAICAGCFHQLQSIAYGAARMSVDRQVV